MSQKWFIAFCRVMDYFNFSFSAFKSSRLSPCSPAVLSTQRFKESMAKEISSSFLLNISKILHFIIADLTVTGNLDQTTGKRIDFI